MARAALAEDYMTQDFLTLQGNEEIGSAQERLKAENRVIGVYVTAEGKLTNHFVIGSEGKRPLLLANRKTPLRTILDMPEIMSLINKGHPGIMLVDNDIPVGVLTSKPLQDYLVQGYAVYMRTAGDETLFGEPDVPRLVITCATCGTVNKLTEFDEGRTKCINKDHGEHVLEILWE
jgi:hypothetical protein